MKPDEPPKRRFRDVTFRQALVAAICGGLVLAFIVFGVISFVRDAERVRRNTLTGFIIEKQFTPAPEQQISVGSKGLKSRHVEGEFVLKVRVDAENRVFEVPVEKQLYEARAVGDTVTFQRPPSEQ